jgi:hypothetical protein
MSSQHHGSCLCGEVRFAVDGDFDRFYLCHCEYCRKDTGSAHAANLFSSTAHLRWLSGEDQYRVFNLPGTRHSHAFCVNCGSALPSMQMQGQWLVVPAGSLDGEVAIKPHAHLFAASRAAWDQALEALPMHDRFPV